MVRWSGADDSSDFIKNRTVQIVSTGSVWQYTEETDPTLETDTLSFHKIRDSIVADNSIAEAQLTTDLANKLNNKVDKFEQTSITLVADTAYTITHNLGVLVPIVTVFENNSRIDLDVDIVNTNELTIKSGTSITVDVAVC